MRVQAKLSKGWLDDVYVMVTFKIMSMLLYSAFSFVLTVCEHDVWSPGDKMLPPGHAFPTGVWQVMSQL